MKPYQSRVITEKAELDARIAKLNEFFLTDEFTTMDLREKRRLARQSELMYAYSDVLGERIRAWHEK